MVHVVSMDEVAIIVESTSFQSNDVRGAQYSLLLLCTDTHQHADRERGREAG